MSPLRTVPRSVLSRALAIQGSWNYETLTGTGFGFAILPALRRLFTDPAALDEAIRRHEGPFNSHPYLAPLALGAVIRMERDGEDPAVIARFKAALRGSLGTLGDQLVWAGWRPICVLVALAFLMAGAPWYAVLVLFLLLYNLGHLGLMLWGLSIGLGEGRFVAERLGVALVHRTQPRLMAVGAFAAALAITLLIGGGVPEVAGAPGWLWAPAATVAALAGIRWGERTRRMGAAGVGVLAAIGVIAGLIT